MFALNHTSIFHLHRRKCAMPSKSLPLSTKLPPPLPPLSLSSSSVRHGRSIAMHVFYSLLILLILSANRNNGKSIVLCDATAVASLVLSPTQGSTVFLSRSSNGRSVSVSARNDRNNNNIDDPNIAATVTATAAALLATSTASQIVNLTRQHGGDVFDAMGKSL